MFIKEFENLTFIVIFKSKSNEVEIYFNIYYFHQSFINIFVIYQKSKIRNIFDFYKILLMCLKLINIRYNQNLLFLPLRKTM